MSTELGIIQNTGSRKVPMSVTAYSGGRTGTCIQLTAEMEEGPVGYVQLSLKDIKKLIKFIEKTQRKISIYQESITENAIFNTFIKRKT